MTDHISLYKIQNNRHLSKFSRDDSNRFSLLTAMCRLDSRRWTRSRNVVILNVSGKYFWGKNVLNLFRRLKTRYSRKSNAVTS